MRCGKRVHLKSGGFGSHLTSLNFFACFAFSNTGSVFDCPACGAKGELHLTIYSENPKPGYLFNLACFCGCDPQKVADEMMRRAQTRRSRTSSAAQ
jgi:hypothetical protein